MGVKELIHGLLILFQGKERGKVAGLLVLIIFSTLWETAGIATIGPFLAVISSPEAVDKSWLLSHVRNLLGATELRTFQIYLGLITAATVLMGNVLTSVSLWLIFRFTFGQGFKIGRRLLNNYLGQPYAFFLEHNTVDLARNVYDEVPRMISGVVLPTFHVVAKSISVLLVVALLVYLDKVVASILLVVFGGSYIFLYRDLQRRGKDVPALVAEMRAAAVRIASEALGGIKELKLIGAEERCVEMYSMRASIVADADARYQMFATLPKYILETVGFLSVVLVVLFLLLRGDPEFTALPLVAVYAFAGYRLMPALQHIYTNLYFIRSFSPSLKIVIAAFEQADGAREPGSGAGDRDSLRLRDAVTFENVAFRYQSAQTAVLESISCKIKAKTVTGLVGTTGSGKSTLLDLLLGLLRPSSGQILIDGEPLDGTNVGSWQSDIGYVPQQIFLTDGTIAENIAFGQLRDEIDMERLALAGKVAHVKEFVQELPDHYDSKIGERGIRLSGGQRQRIGIARALYRNPDMLVLDEATSALDNLTELAVMDTLQKLMGQKTIIIVAHRFTTLRLCDQIILLEGGRIVQQGTYDELLERSEFFRQCHYAGQALTNQDEKAVACS